MVEHRELVTRVFSILPKEGLAVAAHKLFFHFKEVEFLDYIIYMNSVEMSTVKVMAVHSWETLKNLKAVQQFLGFANFYHRFIKNLSAVAQPITHLTQNKGQDFHWGPLQVVGFHQHKDAFTSTPILKHFDPALEVIIEMDVSNFAIGCILFLKHVEKLYPIAYHLRKMEPVEKNYTFYDEKLLTVVKAFKHWRLYYHGIRFAILVFTDYQNLWYFTTSKVLNQRQVY
jgi:hypothetical protein